MIYRYNRYIKNLCYFINDNNNEIVYHLLTVQTSKILSPKFCRPSRELIADLNNVNSELTNLGKD